jgi:hypothetical protein
MKRFITLIVCLAGVSCSQIMTPTPARAQPRPSWSIAGAGCVPTGQTASGTGTFNSAGDVGFPAGRVGEIIVTCPVPPTVVRANGLGITYRDIDGPGNGVQLRAVVRQKRISDGAVSDFSAPFNSNSFGASAANQHAGAPIGSGCAGLAFDHSRFAYYVQVNLLRRQASQMVLLNTVDIGNTALC